MLVLQQANPHLSDLGLVQTKQALTAQDVDGQTLKQYLSHVDFVCSSDMLRAQETAKNLFPSREITVLPYIGEKSRAKLFIHLNLDVENKPQGPIDSVRRLKALGYDTSHFDYELYVEITQGHIPFPNVRKFFQHVVLEHWMNPDSPFYLWQNRNKKDHIKIVLVSHGHFLRDLVSQDTRAMFTFWHSTPRFQLSHCEDKKYIPSRPAIGNVGMFSMKFTASSIHKFLHEKHKFKAPTNIFETNAVYDPKTQTCLKYNKTRFILPEFGHKHHVSRCAPEIQNISTLK
jgi:broad specificity phosphatase PhoE